MKVSDIKKATTSELLARYATVRLEKVRFQALKAKAESERLEIYKELYGDRGLRSGLFLLYGEKVIITVSNGITIDTPVFKDLEECK